MEYSRSKPIVLQADQEHSGLRLLILISLAISGWLSFLLIRSVASAVAPEADYVILLSCCGALPLALPIVWATEYGLKRIWPSGRRVTIDELGLKVNDGNGKEYCLNWSDNLNQLDWFFRLSGYHRGGRERRVPKQWLCFCSQLLQDEHRLIVFAFLSPKSASTLLAEGEGHHVFHEIFPREVYEHSVRSRMGPPSRPTVSSSVLAGKDGRYWLAERRRWETGFELAAKDFERFISETSARRLAQPDQGS
jgi:hypothetical protein